MDGKSEKIKTLLTQAAPVLAERYGFDVLVIFGSHAKGQARLNSDLDIGVLGEISFQQELELMNDISILLSITFVDFVNLGKAPPLLAHNVAQDALVIFERQDGDFAKFRLEAFQKFVETKSLRELNFARTKDYIKQYSTATV